MAIKTLIGICLSLSTGFGLLAAEAPGVVASRVFSLETLNEADHLTGDWAGYRTRLVDRGVHLSVGYAAEYFANVSGGVKRGGTYAGLLETGLDIDSEKLFGIKGNEFHVSALYPHGGSISEYSGDLSAVSNIDAYDTVRLFEIWVQQRFWRDRVSLRLGQLAADEEFAVAEHGAVFINSVLGWPPFYSMNTPAPAYPVTALGARIDFQVAPEFLVRAAVFDGDPGEEPVNNHGTRVRLGSDEGALMAVEATYSPNVAEGGLGGSYKLGAWYHTGDFEHQRIDDTGQSLSSGGSSGTPQRRAVTGGSML